MYWQEIAAELQTYAANTFANIFRGGQGILYRDALINVCKKIKVNFNTNSSVEVIESNLLMKVLTDSFEKMTPDQLKEVAGNLGLKPQKYTPEAIVMALQIAIRMGGFLPYQIAVIVANAVARALIGRGLPILVNAGLGRVIAVFAGPIGWIVTGVWLLFDLAGPAYRVTIPSVIQVAYMRVKLAQKDAFESAAGGGLVVYKDPS